MDTGQVFFSFCVLMDRDGVVAKQEPDRTSLIIEGVTMGYLGGFGKFLLRSQLGTRKHHVACLGSESQSRI